VSDGTVVARAPGRVNLIGDHTDHTGGFVLPLAIDLGTVVRGAAVGSPELRMRSDQEDDPLSASLPIGAPGEVRPTWGRYPAAVAAALGRTDGFDGDVSSTLPVGAGLSSSAGLLVATALALGADPDDPLAVARLCQQAEHAASGVPCGIMDPLVVVAGHEGHALLIDTTSLAIAPVPVPDDVEVVVVHSGEPRVLTGSPYAERARRCATAADLLGPLRDVPQAAIDDVADPEVRAAARHVVGENRRVLEAAEALATGALDDVGRLMVESHRSLRDELDVSTPTLDALVERLVATSGVLGARLTGAGFGGCVVALARPGALSEGRVVRPSAGATVSWTG
jgi:galactokinase